MKKREGHGDLLIKVKGSKEARGYPRFTLKMATNGTH